MVWNEEDKGLAARKNVLCVPIINLDDFIQNAGQPANGQGPIREKQKEGVQGGLAPRKNCKIKRKPRGSCNLTAYDAQRKKKGGRMNIVGIK